MAFEYKGHFFIKGVWLQDQGSHISCLLLATNAPIYSFEYFGPSIQFSLGAHFSGNRTDPGLHRFLLSELLDR